MYSHRAASKTAIDRLERSIEMMGTMPEQIAEAHVRFMGYDLPANCSASVKRGKLLKLLSDEVLREAKQAEREEFVAKAAAKTNASADFEGKDRGRDEKTRIIRTRRLHLATKIRHRFRRTDECVTTTEITTPRKRK